MASYNLVRPAVPATESRQRYMEERQLFMLQVPPLHVTYADQQKSKVL